MVACHYYLLSDVVTKGTWLRKKIVRQEIANGIIARNRMNRMESGEKNPRYT